ncbi:MAG: DEAD/DEAH box helicase, partial [Paracoccus sp. (in: a-proteobacteria)]
MEQNTSRRRPARGANTNTRSAPGAQASNEGRRVVSRDPLPTGPFADMGIDHRINANIAALGLNTPTPIQEQGIPAVVAGRDVLGLAQTGTGKTAAFGLPMLTRLIKYGKKPDPRTCRAL